MRPRPPADFDQGLAKAVQVVERSTQAPPSSKHLESLERKLQLVRTFAQAVAERYMTGFFLWGSGGIGKTHTVTQELSALEANYKVWNSRVTGWGLINNLEKYPDHVHLIEDAESMYRDPRAIGVLRSALDGQRHEAGGPIERWVTWSGDSAARKPKEVFFTGGIIVISNTELPSHKPEVQALKTRLKTLHLVVTDEELRALMRSVSAKGFALNGYTMTPEECGEVCACLEEELHATRSPLSMRLLIDGAFPAYVQHATGGSGVHWRDVVRAIVREQSPPVFTRPVAIRKSLSRAERKAEHQQIVREILGQTDDREERLRLWRERTGLEQSAFYARKAEVEFEE
jgi:hypothetical protein